MRLGAMFKDVAAALFKPPVTQKYPFEHTPVPSRLRGKLVWNGDKCTGCTLCAKDCPSDAIEMVVNDKKAKIFVLRYHVDRCIFCAQCVQNCRLSCLSMSNEEWELAALSKEPFLFYYGKEADIQAYLNPQAPEPVVEAGDCGE